MVHSSLAYVTVDEPSLKDANAKLLEFVASAQQPGDNILLYSTVPDEFHKTLTGDLKADWDKLKMTPADKAAYAEKLKNSLAAKSEEFKNSDAVKALAANNITVTAGVELSPNAGPAVAAKIVADPKITRVYTLDYPKNAGALLHAPADVSISEHINAEFVTYNPGSAGVPPSPKRIMFVVQQEDLGNGQNGLALSFLKDTLKAGDEVFLYLAIADETQKGVLTGNLFKDLKRGFKKDEVKAAVDAAKEKVQTEIAAFEETPVYKELSAKGIKVSMAFDAVARRREQLGKKIPEWNPNRVVVVRHDAGAIKSEIKDDVDDYIASLQRETNAAWDLVQFRPSRHELEAVREAKAAAVAAAQPVQTSTTTVPAQTVVQTTTTTTTTTTQ